MANYYVRKTGLDTNNGLSKEFPFLTINKALETCSEGDIIYIGGGVYSEYLQNITKGNITIIGDTNGINTDDKGLVIVSEILNCTGTNFTVKNIISSSSSYALYVSNNTAKFINCIFCGINGGLSVGASCNGSLYNCIVIGNYAFASNLGAPKKVVNSILIGICESGMDVNFQNCYTLPVGTDIFVDKSNNNYRVKEEYENNVKNLGVYTTDVPTTDIIGVTRKSPPWIGAYDSQMKNRYLIKNNLNYYTVNSSNYDSTTTHSFTPLTLMGGVSPNVSDIDTFGFDDLNLLTNSMTVNTDTFIPVLKFDNTAELKLYKG